MTLESRTSGRRIQRGLWDGSIRMILRSERVVSYNGLNS